MFQPSYRMWAATGRERTETDVEPCVTSRCEAAATAKAVGGTAIRPRARTLGWQPLVRVCLEWPQLRIRTDLAEVCCSEERLWLLGWEAGEKLHTVSPAWDKGFIPCTEGGMEDKGTSSGKAENSPSCWCEVLWCLIYEVFVPLGLFWEMEAATLNS